MVEDILDKDDESCVDGVRTNFILRYDGTEGYRKHKRLDEKDRLIRKDTHDLS
jgi:hypothetical protein